MPNKKKRKSISESTPGSTKLTGFQFPDEAVPDNIPAPPAPGQAVSGVYMITFC